MKSAITGLLLIVSSALGSGQQIPVKSVVVNHVSIINPNASPMADMAIVLSGSRITAVDRAAAVRLPAGAEVIDGRGKFVVPGLADMHHHLASGSLTVSPADMRPTFRQLLA